MPAKSPDLFMVDFVARDMDFRVASREDVDRLHEHLERGHASAQPPAV